MNREQEVSGLLKVVLIATFRGIVVQVLIFGLEMAFLPLSASKPKIYQKISAGGAISREENRKPGPYRCIKITQ